MPTYLDLTKNRYSSRHVVENATDPALTNEGFKGFEDPWKAMSPEDQKEANRLFKLTMKAFPSSPKQKELSGQLQKILSKYGIDGEIKRNDGISDITSEIKKIQQALEGAKISGDKKYIALYEQKLKELYKKRDGQHDKLQKKDQIELKSQLEKMDVSKYFSERRIKDLENISYSKAYYSVLKKISEGKSVRWTLSEVDEQGRFAKIYADGEAFTKVRVRLTDEFHSTDLADILKAKSKLGKVGYWS